MRSKIVDLKQIKDLMTAMEKSGIKKLTLKEKTGYDLQLERHDENPAPTHQMFQGHSQSPLFIPHPMSRAQDHVHNLPAAEEQDSKLKVTSKQEGKWITSPMVGTFYATPSPEDPFFVKVGDKIEENTLVCIIEAMKVMNEVKAGISGTIAEVCLESGHPVEFGTKLFRIV